MGVCGSKSRSELLQGQIVDELHVQQQRHYIDLNHDDNLLWTYLNEEDTCNEIDWETFVFQIVKVRMGGKSWSRPRSILDVFMWIGTSRCVLKLFQRIGKEGTQQTGKDEKQACDHQRMVQFIVRHHVLEEACSLGRQPDVISYLIRFVPPGTKCFRQFFANEGAFDAIDRFHHFLTAIPADTYRQKLFSTFVPRPDGSGGRIYYEPKVDLLQSYINRGHPNVGIVKQLIQLGCPPNLNHVTSTGDSNIVSILSHNGSSRDMIEFIKQYKHLIDFKSEDKQCRKFVDHAKKYDNAELFELAAAHTPNYKYLKITDNVTTVVQPPAPKPPIGPPPPYESP